MKIIQVPNWRINMKVVILYREKMEVIMIYDKMEAIIPLVKMNYLMEVTI